LKLLVIFSLAGSLILLSIRVDLDDHEPGAAVLVAVAAGRTVFASRSLGLKEG